MVGLRQAKLLLVQFLIESTLCQQFFVCTLFNNTAFIKHQDAIRIQPRHVVARYNLAGSLANLGRFEEALASLEVAREADPSNQLVQQRIAQIRALLPPEPVE